MLKVKGPLFKSTLKFIKNKIGEDRFGEFRESLPENVKTFLAESILTSEFYPAETLVAINEHFIEFAGLDPQNTYLDMGRASADEGFSGVYRVFLKVGSPRMMLRQAPLVWKSYYNQGKLVIADHTKNSAVIEIVDSGIRHVSLCSRISGFIERTMQLSGGKNIHFDHTMCFARGDAKEQWKTVWD